MVSWPSLVATCGPRVYAMCPPGTVREGTSLPITAPTRLDTSPKQNIATSVKKKSSRVDPAKLEHDIGVC